VPTTTESGPVRTRPRCHVRNWTRRRNSRARWTSCRGLDTAETRSTGTTALTYTLTATGQPAAVTGATTSSTEYLTQDATGSTLNTTNSTGGITGLACTVRYDPFGTTTTDNSNTRQPDLPNGQHHQRRPIPRVTPRHHNRHLPVRQPHLRPRQGRLHHARQLSRRPCHRRPGRANRPAHGAHPVPGSGGDFYGGSAYDDYYGVGCEHRCTNSDAIETSKLRYQAHQTEAATKWAPAARALRLLGQQKKQDSYQYWDMVDRNCVALADYGITQFPPEGVCEAYQRALTIQIALHPQSTIDSLKSAAAGLLQASLEAAVFVLPEAAGADSVTAEVGADAVNAVGRAYPRVLDPRSGEPIVFPGSGLSQVPLEDRVPWGASERGAYIKEWYDRGYSTPAGGWGEYDIHHIVPREYGGTNDFGNLVPVLRDVHQNEFNPWWRGYR
jgi:hypothetical protein